MNPLLDQVLAGYKQYYNTQYAQISSLAFLTWEYLTTLSEEIELFWTGRWNTPTRILFFINRYQVFAWQIFHTFGVFTPTRTHKFCQAWVHYIVGISALMVVFSVNLILSLRIFGLYGRARWVAILLGIMLPATITVQSYVLARFSPDFISIPLPFSKNIVPCNPSSTEHLYLALIPGLVFDTLVLTLALVRGLIHIQRQRVVGFRGSNIVRVLTRDSASYFLVILLIYTSLIISWVKSPGVEAFATFGYGLATISVAGSRMLFNLKRESMPSM